MAHPHPQSGSHGSLETSPRSRQSSFGTDRGENVACERFEPNPFKFAVLLQKESCKHCGRLWTEHEEVISEDVFEGYLQEMRKAAHAWQRRDASKSEEWLLDGEEEPKGDDDLFHMMSPNSLANVNAESRGARESPGRPKVYSFIDFKECNVPNRGYTLSDESTRPSETVDDLRLALQEAQDEVISLRHRCEDLEAKKMACAVSDVQRLCRDLAHDGPPETAPEAAPLSLRDLEELQQSCVSAIARLKEVPVVPKKVSEEPAAPPSGFQRPPSPRFLPKRLHGAAVLTPLAPQIYRVENRLHAATRGLAYRRSMCPTDVDPALVAPWGSTVTGNDRGDWIQCEAQVPFWAPWAEVQEEPSVEDGLVDSVRKRFGDLVWHLNSMPP